MNDARILKVVWLVFFLILVQTTLTVQAPEIRTVAFLLGRDFRSVLDDVRNGSGFHSHTSREDRLRFNQSVFLIDYGALLAQRQDIISDIHFPSEQLMNSVMAVS